MKRFITAMALLLVCSTGNAQGKIKFAAQTMLGITVGESFTDLQLQQITGVKWKKWFGGLGAGIDWYNFRSVPVFASVNRDIFRNGRNTLLLTGDVGINFPWGKEYYYSIDYSPADEFRPGLYWASGVGYKFGVGKSNNAIMMNFGYSFKQSKHETSYLYPCFNPPCNPVYEKYDYRLKRLSIRLGWIF